MKLLLVTPIVTSMALYVAITYGIFYLLLTTFSFVYTGQYGFDEGTSGLTFLPAGIGMVIGVVGFGQLTDWMVKRNQAKGIVHKPEIRIPPILTIPSGIALPVGLFIYGWTTHYSIHWIVPMFGVLIFAAGMMGVMVRYQSNPTQLPPFFRLNRDSNMSLKQFCIQNYLLDTYPEYAASVTAAMAVLRSLLGAILPLGGLDMYNALGLGWGNSLLAFISLGLIPIPLIFFIYGERIRKRFNPKL